MRRADLHAGLALIGLGGFLWWQARNLPPVRFFVDSIGPGGLPTAIAVGLMLGGGVLAARSILDSSALRSSDDAGEGSVATETWRPEAVGIAASVCFALILPMLGYLLATALLLIVLMLAAGGRALWWKAVLVSIALTPALYALYAVMLQVDLAPGPTFP